MKFQEFLSNEKIYNFSAVALKKAKIIRPDKLERMGISEDGSILLMILPYSIKGEDKNISAYAAPRDYHVYFKDLSMRLSKVLSSDFPGYRFTGAADNSPIDEVHAAVISGLGFWGDNGLLITERYGSYVFIGCIYSDMPSDAFGVAPSSDRVTECPHCGACSRACPVSAIENKTLCLSALTQKKGDLTEEEKSLIKSSGCAWGCDICQDVCPFNLAAEDTEIPFFREKRIPKLTSDILGNMTDEEFSTRAYSWRKRKTIERNLFILEGED